MDANQDGRVYCYILRYAFDFPAHRLVMSTMYSVAALVTTVLNFLILISIWKTPSLHKPSYILIGSLALSDLLVGAIGDPLMAIHNTAALRNWSMEVFCLVEKCAKGVVYTLGAISLLTLTLISLDRFLAVKLKNRYQSVVTQKRLLLSLLTCWNVACIISSTLFGSLKIDNQNLIALLLFVGISVFILVLSITVFYAMAFCILQKISSSVSPIVPNAETVGHSSSNIDLTKYRKSLMTMFVVYILTILAYTPLIIILITASVLKSRGFLSQIPMTEEVIAICISVAEFLSLLNSAMNPLLYLWRIRDIQEAVKTTVKTTFNIF